MKNKTNRKNLEFSFSPNRFQKITATVLLIVMLINGGFVSSVFAQCDYALAIPDYSFNFGEVVTTDISNQSHDLGSAMAVQPDGKVIVAGLSHTIPTNHDFLVVRYNANGTIDTTFGASGIASVDFSNRKDSAFGLALQPNGKIVVVGSSCLLSNQVGGCDFAITRLKANGTRDFGFGNFGKVLTDFAGGEDVAHEVAIQPDAKIVVTGETFIGPGSYGYGLVRYNADGTLDSTFSSNGKAAYTMGDSALAIDLAIQPDGKIVVVGAGDSNFRALRVTSGGGLDRFFGTSGRVSIDFGGEYDAANSVALQANGKIVLGGSAKLAPGASADSALVRLNPNGTLDNSFDGDGKITNSLSSATDIITDIALKSNGEVIAAVNMGSPQTFVVFGYTANAVNPCFFYYSSYISDGHHLQELVLHGTKIYAAGGTSSSDPPSDFLVVALETNIPM